MSDKRPLEPIMNGRPPLLRSNSKDRHVAHVIPSAAGGCGASFSTPTTSLNTNVLTSSSSQPSQHPRASPRQTPTGGNNSSSSSAAFSTSSTAATDANCIPSSAGASPATAPPPLLVVTCPEKRYIRQGRIGKGAFKEVYRAMDEDEGIEVAWSEVDFSQCISKAKVLHEVELLKKMNHPHIIRCFTSWEDPQRQCLIFVTELMTSGTLSDFISQQSRKYLRQNAVVKYGRHILRGLAYLHANDVIHRDLKCSNIFINGNKGEVKIGDLGVSIASRHANSVIGTPEYMAPEMFGEHYTNAIDIWSFGLCLLEMATGRRPYSECDNIGQIYKKLSSGTLPSLEGIHDATLLDVIQSCLAFSPLDRPTAEELLQHAIFYDAAANQPPPPQPATSFCSDGYGSSSLENDSLSCAPPSNMRDLSIVDRLNIMDWLRAAPSVIRDEVISFALCRGWIDQKDSDSIALSSTLPPNGRHHQPVNIPFLDPVQVALTSGGGSNARSTSISSLSGGGGMPTSSAAAAPSLHSTVNAFDPFSSGDSPTMGGGAGGAPTTTPGTQVVGGQHADATAASNGTNQVLSMFPSHSFYDAIEVRSVSGSPVQATATATTTTTTAPNMSQRPPLPHAIVVPSVSDSSACVPQIAVTPSAATSPNRDRKYGAPPIAATGGSFDTEDEGALSGGATTNGSVATPQHSNKTSGVYLSAASRAASTSAVPTVTTLPTPHHFFDEQQQQHNNTSGGVPTTTEEEKRRKAAQSEQKLLAQFEMFSAPVVAATTTNNGVHLPSPAQQSLLTVPTSGNGLHHAASAPNLNARASHIHHYLDPIATSGEEPHQAQDMLAK